MTQEQVQQSSLFPCWAIVEIFGHQRYAGYVSTEILGTAAMFRVDVPALEAREEIIERPAYVAGQYVPAGSKVQAGAVQGYTKLFGVGAIYGITPCTEKAAIKAVESMQQRSMMVIDIPRSNTKAIAEGAEAVPAIDGLCPDCGMPEMACQCEDDSADDFEYAEGRRA